MLIGNDNDKNTLCNWKKNATFCKNRLPNHCRSLQKRCWLTTTKKTFWISLQVDKLVRIWLHRSLVKDILEKDLFNNEKLKKIHFQNEKKIHYVKHHFLIHCFPSEKNLSWDKQLLLNWWAGWWTCKNTKSTCYSYHAVSWKIHFKQEVKKKPLRGRFTLHKISY